MLKILYYDFETTGLNHKKHCAVQIAGQIEINGEIVETFDIKFKPHEKAEIDPAALKANKLTLAEIMQYPDWRVGFAQLVRILSKYVDKYDTKDKMYLCGFNNRRFDDDILRTLFELAGSKNYGSYFWSDSIDVSVLASEYLKGARRAAMPSFKLKRVALTLGLVFDESDLHDAAVDTEITKQVYKIVTGQEMEI